MISNKLTAWVKRHYSRDERRDIAQYGCSSGFSGLSYYAETMKIYRTYKEEIWEILQESAQESGYSDVIQMVADIANHRQVRLDEPYLFENYLVWFAVETIAGSSC